MGFLNFPIRIIGGPEQTITAGGEKFVVNVKLTHGPSVLYPAKVLRAAIAKYDGVPVYEQHWQDVCPATGNQGRPTLGRVVYPVWSETETAVYAMFEPNSRQIEQYLFNLRRGDSRPEISGSYLVIKEPFGELFRVTEIMTVESVDLVDAANAGGAFVTPARFERVVKATIKPAVKKQMR